MSRRKVRNKEILRLLVRKPDADGGASQIPHVIGVTRAAGVGEADADGILLARLKVPDLKLVGKFGKHAKPGVGHTKQHFRMRGALDASRPAFFLVLQLNPQNVAHIALKDALLGLGAASLIFLRPGGFSHFSPNNPLRLPRLEDYQVPVRFWREDRNALALARSPRSG